MGRTVLASQLVGAEESGRRANESGYEQLLKNNPKAETDYNPHRYTQRISALLCIAFLLPAHKVLLQWLTPFF